jgi:hypothetical protein
MTGLAGGNPSEKTDFFIEPKTNEVYDRDVKDLVSTGFDRAYAPTRLHPTVDGRTGFG